MTEDPVVHDPAIHAPGPIGCLVSDSVPNKVGPKLKTAPIVIDVDATKMHACPGTGAGATVSTVTDFE